MKLRKVQTPKISTIKVPKILTPDVRKRIEEEATFECYHKMAMISGEYTQNDTTNSLSRHYSSNSKFDFTQPKEAKYSRTVLHGPQKFLAL